MPDKKQTSVFCQDMEKSLDPNKSLRDLLFIQKSERFSTGLQQTSLVSLQVSELLPKVAKTDAYVEPSLTQLAAMAREDRNSLANVSNFKVGHRRHGHVIWREPVDVCGLDVDHAISFTKGAVEVSF